MDNNDGTLELLILIIFVFIIYIIPTIVAFKRDHPNKYPILIVNIMFGASLVGWLACLIWAMNAVHTSKSGSNGGESGLNIFSNDVKNVKLVDNDANDGILNLLRLQDLLDRGTITREEFEILKRKQMAE